MGMSNQSCYPLIFAVWAAACVADAWWIYYYVQDSINPVPYNATDRSASAFEGFTAMMFIFGFFLSCFNGIWAYGYLCWACGDGWRRSGSGNLLVTLFSLFIAAPVLAFSVIMPFFGGWIVVPIMQKYAWDHYCDSFPAFAILDARSYNDPSYTVNVAYFFMNQPSAGSPTQLFTYEIANTDGGDNWRFSLRSWDTAQSSIPLDFYPTLQAVHYNFYQLTIDGNCTLSANASAAGNTVDNTATVPCMTGTFDPSAHLHFNITSAVPLNSTLVSSYPAAVPNATSNLTIRDSNWDFGKYAPALALQELQPDGQLGHLILKTTVTAPHDSTELKVCVAGPEGRQGAAVQPEVFAPLGLVLMRQADYALYSTQPSSD